MNIFKPNQLDNGHLHAWCLYKQTSLKHFAYLAFSVLVGKIVKSKSITTHLPLELQHTECPRIKAGLRLVKFGNFLAALIRVNLYWENAPLLNYSAWDLKHGPTDWNLVPRKIPLCLDTGHLMLGSGSIKEAQEKILTISKDRQDQIKHLHIHENDLIHDTHLSPNTVLTEEIIQEITRNRTYIFEK